MREYELPHEVYAAATEPSAEPGSQEPLEEVQLKGYYRVMARFAFVGLFVAPDGSEGMGATWQAGLRALDGVWGFAAQRWPFGR